MDASDIIPSHVVADDEMHADGRFERDTAAEVPSRFGECHDAVET